MDMETGAEIPMTGLLYGVPCDKVDKVLQAVGPRSPSLRSAAAPGVRCPWSWLPLVLPAPGETESMSIALRSLGPGQGPP